MRETEKAGKRIPTNEEFSELLGTKRDMPNLILVGRHNISGSFEYPGSYASFWSSTENGADAWYRLLYLGYSSVYRGTNSKALGFSVRCLKD